jgi:16S rRNA (guanine1207-N2)-methyltransferase
MENTSQVILRNLGRLSDGPVLLLNPANDMLARRLQKQGHAVRASTASFSVHTALSGNGIESVFEAVPEIGRDVQTIIMTLPREKDLLRMWLDACSAQLPLAGSLWLVGENRAGIKSAGQYLKPRFNHVLKVDSARHCSLIEAGYALPGEAFDLGRYEQCWTARFGGEDFRVVSLPGVFSHGRLDPGTLLLLEVLQGLAPTGRVLDFASGSGVIAVSVARTRKSDVTLLDDSALAIESGKRTLALNGIEALSLPSDGLTELTGSFDWILSNPPFHRGIRDDLNVARSFFARAGTFLTEKGKICVVFNQHLPYVGWMREYFQNIETLAQSGGFNVIQMSKPR